VAITTRVSTGRTRAPQTRADMQARGLEDAKTFKPVAVPKKGADPAGRQRATLTRNVTNLYRDAPPATVRQGREWYPKAHDEAKTLGEAIGSDTRTGAGIIAAVSPSMSWENNIPAAQQYAGLSDHHVNRMAAANERQKGLARAIGQHERQYGKGAAPAHLYEQHAQATAEHMATRQHLAGTPLNNQSTDNIIKGARIRAGERPEDVLPMHVKTGNFYRNVNDPSDPHAVTVDTHAHDAARGVKLPFKTTRGLTAVSRYEHFAGAYRNAASRVGEPQAHIVQATVWQHWKDRFGNDTSGARGAAAKPDPWYWHEEPTGADRDKAERAIAARSAAVQRKQRRAATG
jgi:hypothetical protein